MVTQCSSLYTVLPAVSSDSGCLPTRNEILCHLYNLANKLKKKGGKNHNKAVMPVSWHHFSLNVSVSNSQECVWSTALNMRQFYWQHLCWWVLVLVKNLFFPEKSKMSPPPPAQYPQASLLALCQNTWDLPWASQHPLPWNTLLLPLTSPLTWAEAGQGTKFFAPSEGPEESSNCQYGRWVAENCVRTTVSPSPKSNEQLSGGNKF